MVEWDFVRVAKQTDVTVMVIHWYKFLNILHEISNWPWLEHLSCLKPKLRKERVLYFFGSLDFVVLFTKYLCYQSLQFDQAAKSAKKILCYHQHNRPNVKHRNAEL